MKLPIVAYENFILWKNWPLASSQKLSVMIHIRLDTFKFILTDWLVSFLLKPSYQTPCLHGCYIQLLELSSGIWSQGLQVKGIQSCKSQVRNTSGWQSRRQHPAWVSGPHFPRRPQGHAFCQRELRGTHLYKSGSRTC